MASPGLLTAQSVRIKQARRLATRAFRRKSGRFLVEGPQAVREALEHRELVIEVYAEPDVATRHRDLRDLADLALGLFAQFLATGLQGAMTQVANTITDASSSVAELGTGIARTAAGYQNTDENNATILTREYPS